jgi:hypothetical protein
VIPEKIRDSSSAGATHSIVETKKKPRNSVTVNWLTYSYFLHLSESNSLVTDELCRLE